MRPVRSARTLGGLAGIKGRVRGGGRRCDGSWRRLCLWRRAPPGAARPTFGGAKPTSASGRACGGRRTCSPRSAGRALARPTTAGYGTGSTSQGTTARPGSGSPGGTISARPCSCRTGRRSPSPTRPPRTGRPSAGRPTRARTSRGDRPALSTSRSARPRSSYASATCRSQGRGPLRPLRRRGVMPPRSTTGPKACQVVSVTRGRRAGLGRSSRELIRLDGFTTRPRGPRQPMMDPQMIP